MAPGLRDHRDARRFRKRACEHSSCLCLGPWFHYYCLEGRQVGKDATKQEACLMNPNCMICKLGDLYSYSRNIKSRNLGHTFLIMSEQEKRPCRGKEKTVGGKRAVSEEEDGGGFPEVQHERVEGADEQRRGEHVGTVFGYSNHSHYTPEIQIPYF